MTNSEPPKAHYVPPPVRKFGIISSLVLFAWIALAEKGLTTGLKVDYGVLNESHDIVDLPAWGPYSKRYAGISHLPDLKSGLRFDVTVLPGFYRFKTLVPNVLFASDYYPWDANSSITSVTYRYELEWKDRVYVDVTYSLLDSNSVLVKMHCVNNAEVPQNLALNLMASLEYPKEFPTVQAKFPETTKWINAVNYDQVTRAHARPDDNLVFNGWMRSEARSGDYVDSSAVAADFGTDRGDKVSYDLGAAAHQADGVISLRYRTKRGSRVAFQLSGICSQRLELKGTGEFEMVQIPFSNDSNGDHHLTLESEGGSAIELNGFFIGPRQDAGQISILPRQRHFTPDVAMNSSNAVVLKYGDAEDYYGLAWNFEPSVVREFLDDELDVYFRKTLQDHVDRVLVGNRLGHYENVFLRPVAMPPSSDRTVYALLCNGSKTSVEHRTAQFAINPDAFLPREMVSEDPFKGILPQGQPYVFGQKMMRATMLANVVYPVYTQKAYIRHFSPGKWWDSLYTWDEGFLALGLEEINPNLATECLNAYTTPADSQSAFIAHGSLVPTQFFAFFDLWNRTQSKELLEYFYPRLKRYYEFLAGEAGSSTTRVANLNLLQPWDYFYNSGGWDDYPPQVAVHAHHLEKSVVPVITTAQCIRCAKILRLAALSLSLDGDAKAYERDIKTFSDALQNHSWDEASGYFSYTMHDSNGTPTGPFKTPEGVNYDMGLDGAYPLFSGICTPAQQSTLLGKIFSVTNMWTPSGICVVDQSAPYYREDGYWNGTVWMPHQWFMWKTMLDLGRPDLAWTIAHKALDVWKTETDESYNVFEHFLATTGRGAGWHQFSSLSAPVLNWFAAYFQPGTVTTGFEVLIKHKSFDESMTGFEADLAFDDATTQHQRSLIVCLNPAQEYQATFNGETLQTTSPFHGIVQVVLPATNREGKLVITPVGK